VAAPVARPIHAKLGGMAAALTIGIDARAAAEVPAGRGRVVRELLRALDARADNCRFVLYARRRWEHPLDDRFRWALCEAPDPVWHARVGRVASRHCDVFLATNSYLSPLLTEVPSVLLVYDLAALDVSTSPNRRSAVVERLTIGPSVRHAAEIVCISDATRRALLARFPSVAPRSRVALLGISVPVDGIDAGARTRLPAPGFVLAVGTLEPRKNLPRLVDAYVALAPEIQAAHPLVVVGASGWRTGETLGALRSLGDRCQMLGHIPDAELVELYRRCAVFCYPSLQEGFGLPVLEAMAAGAAVVTSDTSSLPEVGGDAVVYVDPFSVSEITSSLRRLLDDPDERGRLGRRAQARAEQFSWDAFAAETLEALSAARGRCSDPS
jgi:glycosyltransferase involved in cell wall biosynthesis